VVVVVVLLLLLLLLLLFLLLLMVVVGEVVGLVLLLLLLLPLFPPGCDWDPKALVLLLVREVEGRVAEVLAAGSAADVLLVTEEGVDLKEPVLPDGVDIQPGSTCCCSCCLRRSELLMVA
jgi:hypothetical protein